jgi:hypothetical protein
MRLFPDIQVGEGRDGNRIDANGFQIALLTKKNCSVIINPWVAFHVALFAPFL